MSLAYTITPTVTTSPLNDNSTRLFHGTVGVHADCIVDVGISADHARQAARGADGGSFWLTDDYWEALNYSRIPSYHDGEPTVIAVDLLNESIEFV